MKKYGIPLIKEFNIEYKLEKKDPDVFKLLRKLLSVIAYNIRAKIYTNKNNKKVKYYTITEKKLAFTKNDFDIDKYILKDE